MQKVAWLGYATGSCFHALDQNPYEIEFEKLAQNVNHAVVWGISGVIEAALGLNPIEELECAFPIISVAGEGLAQWGDYRAWLRLRINGFEGFCGKGLSDWIKKGLKASNELRCRGEIKDNDFAVWFSSCIVSSTQLSSKELRIFNKCTLISI